MRKGAGSLSMGQARWCFDPALGIPAQRDVWLVLLAQSSHLSSPFECTITLPAHILVELRRAHLHRYRNQILTQHTNLSAC